VTNIVTPPAVALTTIMRCSSFSRKIDKESAACAADQPAATLSGGSVTLFLVGAVETFFLAVDAKPNVLMNWIVTDDVGRPDIKSIGHVSVNVVQCDVIAMKRRWRRLNRSGPRLICRTCNERRKTNEVDED
jgi:hypothetical protein